MRQVKNAGYVTILGRPNVGKSTLMNQMIGQKISITSSKPQTTRHVITGIYTDDHLQIVFFDTPGVHRKTHETALNRHLNRSAVSALDSADVILFMLEAGIFSQEDQVVLQRLGARKNVILVINKIDRIADKTTLLPFMEEMMAAYPFMDCIPISAVSTGGKTLLTLREVIARHLPEQPFIYDENEITTASRSFLAAEVLREKLTRRLNQELPYALTVDIESFVIEDNIYRIHAVIWIERESQKGIVIGKQGALLKEVSRQARIDLEKLFENKVFLRAYVKVRSGWSDDERALQSLGFKTSF